MFLLTLHIQMFVYHLMLTPSVATDQYSSKILKKILKLFLFYHCMLHLIYNYWSNRRDLPPHRIINIQSASTTLKINSIPISIASWYFPPGIPFPIPELIILLQSLSHSYIIGADFNAKHQTWSNSTNSRGRALHNLVTQLHLKILSSTTPTYLPTHANRHPDTIDFFISSMSNRFITHVTNLNNPASDQTPVLLHIGAQLLLKQNRPTITAWITNWNTFRDILSKKTLLNIKLKSSADIDSAINLLTNNIQNPA